MQNHGILDYKGQYPNPLTGEPYSEDYKKLAEVWSKFPAYENARDIIDKIKSHQVILIISGTGSGKTVLIPKYVLHVFDYDKKIAITLPKQIIAKSAAEFAAKTLDVKLGQEVGYQYKNSDKRARSNKTQLLYATDGTIVARLLRDPLLSDFNAVVIDEAHERKIQIDFLLYLLKNVIINRPEFKLIIMSATVNEKIFESYYSSYKFVTINVGAKTNYPIESVFLKKPIKETEYLDVGFDVLKYIVKHDDLTKKGSHDILFFINSSNEAKKICEKISNDKELKEQNICIEVYSGMPEDKQILAQDKDLYKEKYNKQRKLVIATNVAESSLTIDGIKYVIDSGYEIHAIYNPEYNSKELMKQRITTAQAKQRMGRAGRIESGYCYHLYTREEFEKMKPYPEPTIKISNLLSESIKLMYASSISSFSNLLKVYTRFIEPPKEEYIRSCYNQMIKLNLLKNDKLTNLTKIINELNLDVRISIACIMGKKLRCLNETVALYSCLDICKYNIGDAFNNPQDIIKAMSPEDKQLFAPQIEKMIGKYRESRAKYDTKYGDITSFLKMFIDVYGKYINNRQELEKYCEEKYFNYKNWAKICQSFERNIRKIRIMLKPIEEISEIKDIDLNIRLLSCFYYANRDNIVQEQAEKYYNPNINLRNIELNKNSYLQSNKLPNTLFYLELSKNMGKYEIGVASRLTEEIERICDILESNNTSTGLFEEI